MLLPLFLLVSAAPDTSQSSLDGMVALYDELCLKAFPDDKAVDALMVAKGAVPLTPEQVRVTFNDDPGRGWLLADGDRKLQIMLELPPYHACSVRATTPDGFGDLTAYRSVTAAFKQTRPGFGPAGPFDMDRPELQIHVHAVGEERSLPDGRTETLYLFDQHVTDATRRANGETGVDIRFVHQIIDKGAPP